MRSALEQQTNLSHVGTNLWPSDFEWSLLSVVTLRPQRSSIRKSGTGSSPWQPEKLLANTGNCTIIIVHNYGAWCPVVGAWLGLARRRRWWWWIPPSSRWPTPSPPSFSPHPCPVRWDCILPIITVKSLSRCLQCRIFLKLSPVVQLSLCRRERFRVFASSRIWRYFADAMGTDAPVQKETRAQNTIAHHDQTAISHHNHTPQSQRNLTPQSHTSVRELCVKGRIVPIS